jgi:hypothetical protein
MVWSESYHEISQCNPTRINTNGAIEGGFTQTCESSPGLEGAPRFWYGGRWEPDR